MAKKPGMATGVEVARISVKVSPNTKEFRSELKKELEEIERTLRGEVGIAVDIDSAGAQAKFAETLAKMRAEASRPIKIDVDTATAGANLSRLGSSIGSSAGGLGGGGVAAAVAVAALAAPALAVVTGLLTTLPAIAAAVVVPIGAIALGLDGIKKAAESLKTPLDKLKQTMSKAFEVKLTPVFKRLLPVFPLLNRELPGVASGLAEMAGGFVDAVTSAPGMKKIQNVIDNVKTSLSDAAPGVNSFTTGMLGLAEGVSAKFPAVSKYVSEAGDSFSKWVEKVTADGSLDTAMDNLGGTLKEVLGLVKDIGKQGFEWLSDPEFGKKMKEFVSDMRTLVNDVMPGLKNAFIEIQGYIHPIVGALDKVDKWKPPDWVGMKSDKERDTGAGGFPGVEPEPWRFSDGKTFAEKVKEMFKGSGDGAGDIFELPDFGPVTAKFEELKASVSATWDSIKNAAMTAWGEITSTVSSAIEGVKSAATNAWSGITSAASSAWEGVKSTVASAIESVIGFVSGMGSSIISAITSIDLIAAGKALMSGLLNGIKAGAQAVYDFVSGIASKIASLKGPLPYDRKVLVPNGEALMDGLGTGLENGLTSVLETAKGIADQIRKAMDTHTEASLGISSEDLKRSAAAFEQEKKRLKVLKDQAVGKDAKKALQNQIDQLQAQKNLVDYQRDATKGAKDYADATGDSPFVKAAAGLGAAPVNFAKATGKQFLNDIGISGEGAVSKAVTEGISYIFQVGSVDEALSVKDREESKKALSVVGRT